jgi:hypothetical protein
VRTGHNSLLDELQKHERGLESHLKRGSKFLVACQIVAPYVERGLLHGCVCPWEIGESAEEGAFPILEDFHDTLEAIWVWTLYSEISGDMSFRTNINWAWKYIVSNWKRFIDAENMKGKGLYDCSYVLFSGTLFESVFGNSQYRSQLLLAGNRLSECLCTLESMEGREYSDPFWMVCCLGLAAKKLRQKRWRTVAEAFVKNTVVDAKNPFTRVDEEPVHQGPGGHDFFSKNANVALALISCFGLQRVAKEILLTKFLPCIPAEFVIRHADENAWNAHLATALGKSYALTGESKFLRCFFAIIDELARRDRGNFAALPRSPSFGRRESWVTFFYAHAYASITKDFIGWV